MNPTQVKKREYAGLLAVLGGVLVIVLGAFGLFYAWQAALVVLSIGIAVTVGGVATLAAIPDLIHTGDERW